MKDLLLKAIIHALFLLSLVVFLWLILSFVLTITGLL